MSAQQDQLAEDRLNDVLAHQRTLDDAVRSHARAKLRFIRDARTAGWSWQRIGDGLGLTDRGASQYWSDHRMEAGRLA